MRRMRAYLLCSLGFIVLVAALTAGTPKRGRSQGPVSGIAVNVLNNPLPVSGKVSAAVSGAVSAQESGPWNVGVTSLPAVQSQQSGAWNVGLLGTPTVNALQSGPLWMMGLDPGNNAVHDDALATKMDSANASLGKLSFDGGGNLMTAPQGTQNVKIVGGSLDSNSVSKAYSFGDTIDHAPPLGQFTYKPENLPSQILTSTLVIWAERPLEVFLMDPFEGVNPRSIGFIGGGESKVINFTQPVPITALAFENFDPVGSSQVRVVAYGR